jgi:proteic killer suppression protein
MLDLAARIEDLYFPPGNHFHRLGGNLEGFYAIRVDQSYRIIFRWTDQGPADVQFTEYHYHTDRSRGP